MKVLLCQPTLEFSGSEMSLLQIIKGMRDEPGNSIWILAGKDGPLRRTLESLVDGIWLCEAPKMNRNPVSILAFLKSFKTVFSAMRDLRKKTGIDLVHVNSLMFPQATLGAFFNRLPVVVHLREVATTYPRPAYFSYLAVSALAARAIIPVCRHAALQEGIPRRLSRKMLRNVIHNSSDAETGFIRREVGRELVLLMAIPITARKGAAEIVEIAAELEKRMPGGKSFVIRVAGRFTEPALFESIKAGLRARGLEGKVAFLGPQSEMSVHFREAHAVIHPSHSETFSRIWVEAGNYSLPCIATDVGGAGEAIQEPENGFLVKVGDVERMAECAATLAKDQVLYDRLAAGAFRIYSQRFSRTAMVSKLGKAWAEVVGHGIS